MLYTLAPQGQESMGSSTLNDSNRGSPRELVQQGALNQGFSPSKPERSWVLQHPVHYSTVPHRPPSLAFRGECPPPHVIIPNHPDQYGCRSQWRVPDFGWADRDKYSYGSEWGTSISPKLSALGNRPRPQVLWGPSPHEQFDQLRPILHRG
jgi:hypothetical protein